MQSVGNKISVGNKNLCQFVQFVGKKKIKSAWHAKRNFRAFRGFREKKEFLWETKKIFVQFVQFVGNKNKCGK